MKIKINTTLLAAFMLLCVSSAFPQAKKPTIMILPSDVWCNTNGYMIEFDNQGTKVKVPDYKKAFQENADLLLVISKINGLMADRGFPLKNAESVLKSLANESAEDAMLTSKGGAGVVESPIDKLKKSAKADIIMQLTWTVNTTGPKKSITFNLQGLDSYTDKQIATAAGTGAPSFSAELPVLLEEAVLAHLDLFNNTLQAHFTDMFDNGREITIRIKKFDSWENDLETDYEGKELSAQIEDWLAKNTVKGRFSTTDATDNMMYIEQVRIPLYDETGKAIDARGFCKGLQTYLKNPPYSIVNKLMMKGLGQATIVLGDK
ncbi:MAG: hypothetical protein A2X08_09935 [Bacteroidetes bacterium GWA2_32_17]|nr:MAG: hypothetical protein A2X08_09935 [Bacteroidetes bacterium GWA2_32_17]